MNSLFRGFGEATDCDAFVRGACAAARAALAELTSEGTVQAIDDIWDLQQQFQGFAKGSYMHARRGYALDVMEMSRRCDRALIATVRHAQQEGTVRSNRSATTGRASNPAMASPQRWTMKGNTRQELYALYDRVSDEEFERALAAARTDGNLSRRNVLRHIRQGERTEDWIPSPEDHTSAAAARRVQLIREMAAEKKSSRSMNDVLGTLPGTIRIIARRNGIEIPADKIISKTRIHNADRIMEEAVNSLAGVAMSLELVEPPDVNPELAAGWLASITTSIKTINQVAKSVREETS